MSCCKNILTLIFISIFTASLTACFGGSDDGVAVQEVLQVSSVSAAPGYFISVEHDSIAADSAAELEVRYSDTGDVLSIASVYTESGKARFIVPAYFDSDTDRYTQGTVRLTLKNTNAAADFLIEAPDDLGDTQPGYVLAWVLGNSLLKYQSAITDLTSLQAEYNVDVSELQSQLSEHIALLESSISEIETLGQLTIVDADGTVYVLGADELKQNDALFFSIATGFVSEYELLFPDAVNVLSNAQVLPYKVELSDLPPHVRTALEKWSEGLKWASVNAPKLGSALLGGVGIVVTVKAGIIGLPIIFVGAVGYVIVDGTLSEGLDSLIDKLTLNDADGYEFGHRMLESAEESLNNLLLSLGGAKSKVVDFISTIYNGKSIYDAFGIEKCDALEQPQEKAIFYSATVSDSSVAEFCADLGETPGLSVPLVGPFIVNPEAAASWAYLIYGGVAPYEVSISWGDGAINVSSNAGSSGLLSHSYENSGRYIIELTVTSSDGLTGDSAALVLVESADSMNASISIDGYFSNYSFEPDLVFVGFGSISENDQIVQDEIPGVVGINGAISTPTMEAMSILVSKDLSFSLPPYTITSFSRDPDELLDGSSLAMIDFVTPQVKHEDIEIQVVFIATGGSLILDEYGTQLGDRFSGRFNIEIQGERSVCTDPPVCDVYSDEVLTGTAIGEFEGTLKSEEDFQ